MLVLICSDLVYATDSAKKLYNEHNISSCAVEAEYKTAELNEKNEGIGFSMNHHSGSGIQPSRVYENNYNVYSSFIISHIDSDTIFGIGWVSGLFYKRDKKMQDISKLISEIDISGIHNVCIPQELEKEIQVIFSIVAEAKNKLAEIRYKNKYNVTSIVRKAILKIKDHVHNKSLLERRYKLIKANLRIAPLVKEYSDDKIHVFRNRMNDFLYDRHKFIINFSRGIVIYGRNDKITSNYFPDGLPNFLSNWFRGSGGHFSAAGTSRNVRINKKEFESFLDAFRGRIESVDKKLNLKIIGNIKGVPND